MSATTFYKALTNNIDQNIEGNNQFFSANDVLSSLEEVTDNLKQDELYNGFCMAILDYSNRVIVGEANINESKKRLAFASELLSTYLRS